MLRAIWRALVRRSDWERGMADEIREHLEARTEDLVRAGVPRPAAERRARIEFGSRESWKEECRQAAGFRWLDEFRQDLRYATRVLRRTPGFTAIAISSLALGIGANTVVFSVLNALLLHPVDVPDPSTLWSLNNGPGPSQSFPNYLDVRDRNHVFESLFAYRVAPMSLEGATGAQRVWGYLVTGNYFESLGVRPALGRFFGTSEDRIRNGSPYAVLSHACWRNRFASDPHIIGRTVRINRYTYTVLGITPRGFHGTEAFYWPEIWIPMSMQARIETYAWLDQRSNQNAWVAGRLKAGVGVREAEANLSLIASQLAREHRVNEGMRLTLSRPGLAGSLGHDPTRMFAAGIMLLAGLVLIAACVNLAALVAARTTDRHRELALRA